MRYSNWLRSFLHYYGWTAHQLLGSRVRDAVRDAYLRGWSPTTAAQFVDDLLIGDWSLTCPLRDNRPPSHDLDRMTFSSADSLNNI